MRPLTAEEIAKALITLDVAWSAIPGEGLVRIWDVGTFAEGFTMASRLAAIIRTYQCEPTLLVNPQMVQLVLTTPDGSNITAKEVALAESIDKLLR